MSHEINIYVGRQDAWHGLGTVTGQYLTWADLIAHGLNFGVEKQQLFSKDSNPVEAWGTFRTDTGAFLGSVGERYEIIHHSKGFEMIDELVAAQNEAHYETAGALRGGAIVWGLVDLQIPLRVGNDVSDNYLLFYTSHDGSCAHTYGLTSVRVVCANTLRMAMNQKRANLFNVRHTKNAKERLDKAHQALMMLGTEISGLEERLNFLATRMMTKQTTISLLDRLFPKTETEDGRAVSSTRRENILVEILENYESNDRNAFPEQRGTAYNMLNAITGYVDHARSSRGGEAGRYESAVFGQGNRLKSQALEILVESANGLPARSTTITVPLATPEKRDGSLLDQVLANTRN
ncbi:MAG: DUF932 domain-containing protein [Candidatus Binatia bacterium]